jgi:hypothetical protein
VIALPAVWRGVVWALLMLWGQVAPDDAWTLDGVQYRATQGVRARVLFAPVDSLVAPRVLALLDGQGPLPGLSETVPAGVTAALAHSTAAFDELTGGRVPEWRAGVAVPDLDLLVMPTGEGPRVLDPEGRRVLRHEWAHLGLHQSMGDLRIPRWFDEGYAQWASGGFDAADAWKLRVLMALGRAPPLDSLTLSWPRDRASAEVAYLLAASAVTYLLGDSGPRGLEVFLGRWRVQRSFEAALRETFGVTSGQFEEDWKGHVRRRYGWLFVLSHSAIFWMLLALVLLVMVRVRHGLNRDRLARLRAVEGPDRPAYWDAAVRDVPASDAPPQGPEPEEERPS